jgi:phenylalanyl-tRNA synthetase beta chain
MPAGRRAIKVDEQRRREMPYLRPSIIPSLLKVRRDNQDGKVQRAGGIRLFEIASVFSDLDTPDPAARQTVETRTLALLIDVDPYTGKASRKAEAIQQSFRAVRGTIEQIVAAIGGSIHKVTVQPVEPPVPAYRDEVVAAVLINGEPVGHIATITSRVRTELELEVPLIAAEFDVATLVGLYPPANIVTALPAFPPIERDLSVIVDNAVARDTIASHVQGLELDHFEDCAFIGTFRGEPIPAGRKSVTMRLTFRDPSRTLRREEADDSMARVMSTLKERCGAEIRQ